MALLFVVKKWVFGDLWHLLYLIFREVFEGAPIEFEDYLAVLNILLSHRFIHRDRPNDNERTRMFLNHVNSIKLNAFWLVVAKWAFWSILNWGWRIWFLWMNNNLGGVPTTQPYKKELLFPTDSKKWSPTMRLSNGSGSPESAQKWGQRTHVDTIMKDSGDSH